MKIKVIIISMLIMLLTACASTSSNNSRAKFSALYEVRNDMSMVLEVPSANNSISNALMVASIQSGADTTGVVGLVSMLKNNIESVAVVGNSDAVVAATITSSVNRLKDGSSTKIYFIGAQQYVDELSVLSEKSGVEIDAVSYP